MDSYHSTRLIALPTSSSWMGEDLCVEIFKRLPVKSLLRFRCVCKSWKTLISSSFFNNLHHSFTSSTTPSNLKPYVLVNFRRYCGLFGLGYDPVPPLISCTLYRPQTTLEHVRDDLHFPFRFKSEVKEKKNFACVGVIHGLVCVSYTLSSSFDSTILWNPAICKYFALPRLPYASQFVKLMTDTADVSHFSLRYHSSSIGFGYDSSKNDFKVVRIWIPSSWFPYSKSLRLTYEVYSYREGLWRVATADFNINSFRFVDLTSGRTSCFVNGTIHWLIKSHDRHPTYHVLMFDCEREEFSTTELPKKIYPANHFLEVFHEEILEFVGMLAVLVHGNTMLGDYSEMWMMEEHGVATTWKKLYETDICCTLEMKYDDKYQNLFGKLAPYGPNQWTKDSVMYFDEVLSSHVFEESMYLMDDAKAQSYTKEETVYLN